MGGVFASRVVVVRGTMLATCAEAAEGVPVRDAGYRAIDTLSAEKNYRHWHADLACCFYSPPSANTASPSGQPV